MAKNVIITGASSGIGAALAHAFASRGYNLGLAARRLDKLEALAQTLKAQYAIKVAISALDVQEECLVAPALNSLAQQLGSVDIVIANAGIAGSRRSGNGKLAIDKAIFQTNLIGAIATLDAATSLFLAQGHGQLVGISSFSAFAPLPSSAAYSASKAALSNYMNAMRLELHHKSITVTVIHPGFIKTELGPNMEKYPFVAEAETAALEMLAAIEAKKANVIVPALPWKVAKGILQVLPDKLMTKLFEKMMKG